jgi:hypothetical protein
MMRENPEKYERGTILFHLMANRALTVPMAFVRLQKGLRVLGLSLTAHDLRDHLEYLLRKGYLEVIRMGEVPGLRLGGDDAPDHIMTLKLTPQAVDLLEKTIQDEGVAVP